MELNVIPAEIILLIMTMLKILLRENYQNDDEKKDNQKASLILQLSYCVCCIEHHPQKVKLKVYVQQIMR